MELRSGQIIHRSSVSWLRPIKWQDNPNHILVYNYLRYYLSKDSVGLYNISNGRLTKNKWKSSY